METIKFEINFIESVLGTICGNKETASDFIAAKNPNGIDPAELAAIPDFVEELRNVTTVFARNPDGIPMFWDYQIKGFFKSACQAMIESGSITAEAAKKRGLSKWTFKRTLDQQLFVFPRMIPILFPGEIQFIERPLRASTRQGERIALARSESIQNGTIEILVKTLRKDLMEVVAWAMEYGELSGIGQWRNSGMGRFTFVEIF